MIGQCCYFGFVGGEGHELKICKQLKKILQLLRGITKVGVVTGDGKLVKEYFSTA